VGGRDITHWGTRDRREAGVGYIPEDRHRHALLLDAPLWENRILGFQRHYEQIAEPFAWTFTRRALRRLMDRWGLAEPASLKVAA
ncbi:MAG: heme ABC transporter ATP-binding protein, partial [Gemmatimonadota bacterium]